MLHPKYDLQIGSVVLKPESSNENISMTVSASMNSPSDTFEGTFRSSGQAIDIKKEDILKLSLGYEDGMSDVFHGKVEDLIFRTFDMRIIAYSSTFNLSRVRKDKFYEERTAGQIVKDLADVAGVDTKDIEDGVKFPYYAVDSNKNAYEHIKELAGVCGFDTYCNNKDQLMFKKYNPKTKHPVTYGKNIIRVTMNDWLNVYDGVTVIGESPASESGPETSHWLKKEPMQSFAGNQDFPLFIVNRAVKDEQTAKKIAEENLNTIKSQLVVVMDLVGNPEIMLGDGVTVDGVPNKGVNGDYQIRTIEHHFTKSEGFITTIKCRGKSKE